MNTEIENESATRILPIRGELFEDVVATTLVSYGEAALPTRRAEALLGGDGLGKRRFGARPRHRAVRRRFALLVLCMGFCLVLLDSTAVTVALPTMQTDLGSSPGELQWIVDSYTLVFAAFLLGGGALTDRLGALRVYVVSIVVFAISSAMCAVVTDNWLLITARGVQGIGAAGMMPASLALLRSTFPEPAQRARAIGIWGGLGGVAAALGPLLGGVLVTSAGWQTLFWINVPLGALTAVLSFRSLRETETTPSAGYDVVGQLTSFAGLGALVAGVIELGHNELVSGAALTGGGLALLLAFLRVERRHPEPLLATVLVRDRGLIGTALTGAALNFGLYGMFFLVTLYLQQVLHLSPVLTGLMIAVVAAGSISGSLFAGWFTARTGPLLPMIVGLLCGAAGYLHLSGTPSALPELAIALFVVGFGVDVGLAAATVMTLRLAPAALAGAATAVLTTMRQIGSALGVAVFGGFAAVAASLTEGFSMAMITACAVYVGAAVLTLVNRVDTTAGPA
ncbi:MFS transporter [Lentzea fradiae]|uniref:MFS transporter n=1 Tax=Lentzea fradiae TaxID=200378 RepID=UPI0015A2A4A2|nr:MFS transporter [Lentzea fradiae]